MKSRENRPETMGVRDQQSPEPAAPGVAQPGATEPNRRRAPASEKAVRPPAEDAREDAHLLKKTAR